MDDMPALRPELLAKPDPERIEPRERAQHPPRILLLYGSLRERSYSRLLTLEAERILRLLGAETRVYDPGELPIVDSVPADHPKVAELRALSLWSEGQVWCSPEPHAFDVLVRCDGHEQMVTFEEHEHHEHGAAHHDNNMRAAVVHVLADAVVSVLVIVGLLLARFFGWVWLDPAAGLLGAVVIAAWSYGLIRDTGAILLDMTPDQRTVDGVRRAIEAQGDRLADLHVWRLGPGHLGAIVSVVTSSRNGPEHYRALLRRFGSLSHVTVEVLPAAV